jgi:two-component system, sensor histidine kinase and response regulator
VPTLTRILLIDDDAVDRQAVRRALGASDLNWDLTEAASGAEGLAAARDGRFDCVLLDYRLPDASAFDLLADLLAPESGGNAVMMLTGESDPEAALNLMRAGALDHLAKAEMTPQTLARAIRYAKARRGFVAELQEKSAALDALNRQKSLLLSIIAHDLRNPFQVMLGMSEVLSKAVADREPAKIERRAQGIRQAAEQAHTLMEDLFTWASLQMDQAEVVMEPVALEPLARAAADPCRKAAEQKGVTVEVDCEGSEVIAQRDMLSTILRNLVGNAVKFTPAGGRVTVRAPADGDAWVLEVSDTGIGMDADTQERLFRLEQRVTTLGTEGEKGSGLGLLLCRDLAERLGTTLGVRSEPGRGTTFCLRLPRA